MSKPLPMPDTHEWNGAELDTATLPTVSVAPLNVTE